MNISLTPHLRIIWAIITKDFIDAMKNKNVLGVIIPALFVIVLYRFLPAINAEEGPPNLLVYDAGNPSTLSLLEESPVVNLYTYDSESQMRYFLSNGEQPELGLVIPIGFDQSVDSGQTLELQGYMLHFFADEQVTELQHYVQDEFEYLLSKPVSISIEKIQLQPETQGITILASLGFSFVIMMVGMIAVPHMFLEEKQNKTLDAIRVSPASSIHIVVAKAVTGIIYTMIVYGIGLFMFRFEIVHWNLGLLSGLLGALFAVSLGLLLGILVDTRQQLILWAWVIILPLFLPMMLSIMDNLLPKKLLQVLKWVPSSALMQAIRSSMIGTPPPEYYLPQLFLLLFFAVFVLAIDIWQARRLDH